MPAHLPQHYGPVEGPLGFPCTDRQALALDAVLKALPRDDAFRYRKAVVAPAPTEVAAGERSDVSWITTEDPDRAGDVVLARGMNDAQFKQNPIVTLNHCYWQPPVGRSLWRKAARDGARRGIKAKTVYPARPKDWPADHDWPADVAFALVAAELLNGKSIGFLPTRVRTPESAELDQPGWKGVTCVVEEWLLLEYACVFLPCQAAATVETVATVPPIPADIQRALGIDLKALLPASRDPFMPFTPLAEVERAVERRLRALDPQTLLEDRLDRRRGRV